jgi:HEAT repeat protein/TolA-binding protein
MRHTLTMILAAAVPMLAVAQVPAPPQPASPPQRAEPAQRPQKPAPAQRPQRDWDFDFNFDKFRFDDMRFMAEDAARLAGEAMRFNQDDIRRSVEEARFAVKEMALLDMDRIKVDVEHARASAIEAVKHMAEIDVRVEPRIHVEPLVRVEPFGFGSVARDKFSEAKPPRAWASEDPADSLYRVARETLIRGEYRRAAQMFNDIVKRFPRSEYVVSCTYWEAFARYRSGSTDDLRQALRILDEGRTSLASLRTNQDAQVDVPALRARVQAALAARGDQDAERALRREMNEQSSCDPEEMAVKAEALSALGQMDAASALPVVKKVLARRDECTKELRRRALYVVGRQAGPESAAIILDVAKNDTDANIRSEAMRWLPRVGGDNAIPQLEEMLRTSTDESAQRSIISALNSMDSERARRAVRAIIERADASERVRYEAIGNFLRERDGRQPSAEEQNYIRGLYTKLESAKLREAVLHSIGRVETTENQQFLMGIVRNQGETPSLRASALERLGRMESVSVNDIAKLYDIADTRSLREQVLRGLSQRKEDVAVDKMIEIARKDTDPQIRRSAINMLARSSNKRAQDFIKEIFDR